MSIWLVLDTETTDLFRSELIGIERQPRIVEFCGMLLSEDGTVVKTLDFLCRPPVPMSSEAEAITGLTDKLLAEHPPFAEFAGGVADLMAEADAVVAHNLLFDERVIDIEFSALRKIAPWPKRKICTVAETEWISGKRMKLGDLYEYLFGNRFSEAHRARNDVAALVEVVNELRERGML